MSRALSTGYWKWAKHIWSEPLFFLSCGVFPVARCMQQWSWAIAVITPIVWLVFPLLVMVMAHFRELDSEW